MSGSQNSQRPSGEATQAADELFNAGHLEAAVAGYLESTSENQEPSLCVRLARCHEALGNRDEALRWALAAAQRPHDFTAWKAAAAIGRRAADAGQPARRDARLAVLGSYTTNQFTEILWLAARAAGVSVELYESAFGQYRQEIIDPASAMYGFAPELVLLAVHEGELGLPVYSEFPDEDVAAEVERWRSLWETLARHSEATVVQHLFALPPEAPFGHLGATLAGARSTTAQAVNAQLAAAATGGVAVVDCERLSALIGKRRWFDPRYWHLAKQGVALGALPLLASHTAAVIAARLGLGRKCLVLDLDNTLWGGTVGEDGIAALRLGGTPDGEAFQAFQEAILALKRRGIVLAVCSKNNAADAREVFERHPEMRIGLDDIAVFVADWRPKPEQLLSVASELDIGLDSVVFVDDNPVEREAIRRFLPDVDVIVMPRDPSEYVRALDEHLSFEPASFTVEDSSRTEHYQARRRAAEARASAVTIEDFYRSLEMRTRVASFTDADLSRIAQLVGKTNQFNLTTRRRSLAELRSLAEDPDCLHLTFRLSDRFTDHGLIALVIGVQAGETLEIDTWLMSCRVIGRSLERTVLEQLCRGAIDRGCTEIRGLYVPTAKNGLVADLYPRLGFKSVQERDGATEWVYDLARQPKVTNEFIEAIRDGETERVGA